MLVSCKRGNALQQQNDSYQIIERVNELYVSKKNVADKSLKNLGDICFPGTLPCPPGFLCYPLSPPDYFCVPQDIGGTCPPGFEPGLDPFDPTLPLCIPIAPPCLECTSGALSWSYQVEKFYCDDGSGPLSITLPDPFLNGDCDCPDGQIMVDNGGGNFNCAYPLCFDTEIDYEFTCDGNGEVTVTLEPLDGSGMPLAVFPPNAVITVDNLTNCDFSDPDAALLYQQSLVNGNTVALSSLTFTVILSGPGGASLLLPDLGVSIEIPDMNCPVIEIEDPCDCDSPFDPALGSGGLFQDQLNVSGLLPGQNYTLVTNNGGFYNALGILYPNNTVFTADATGAISQVFYRGPGQSADIVMSTGNPGDIDINFISPEPCPTRVECGLAVIPTLGQWGIITLSILLTILGVARIKSMEQDAIEKVL